MVSEQQIVRIKLRSYDHYILNQSCKKIVDVARITQSTIIGPIPLPTKRKIYCVLRSPHVDKDSREHFEIRSHYRILDLFQPSLETIDALIKLSLPFGVDIEVQL